jgi:surface-anchored protein
MLRPSRRTTEAFGVLLVLAVALRCSEASRPVDNPRSTGGATPGDAGGAGESGARAEAAEGGNTAGGGEAASGDGGRALAGATHRGGESGSEPPGGAGGESANNEDGGSAGRPESAGGASGEAGSDGSSDCELRYTEGHGDLFIGYEAGLQLSIRSAFGAMNEQLVDPARVCVIVPAASYELTVSLGGAPEGEEFAFLGVPAGEAFWMFPASPRAGMPWFGAATEAIPSGLYADDKVVLSITELERPANGDLSMFTTDALGAPTVLYSTVTGALSHAFPTGAHLHFNWAFTAAGAYTLTFRAEGTLRERIDSSPYVALRFMVLQS